MKEYAAWLVLWGKRVISFWTVVLGGGYGVAWILGFEDKVHDFGGAHRDWVGGSLLMSAAIIGALTVFEEPKE